MAGSGQPCECRRRPLIWQSHHVLVFLCATFAPATVDSARKANGLRRHILEFQDCITSLEKCEKPVICMLHGISFGLALGMSLSCDVRISLRASWL
ncbi:hypothetical protein DPSP01_001794 [Paraphaeosphaeria sporulosa]